MSDLEELTTDREPTVAAPPPAPVPESKPPALDSMVAGPPKDLTDSILGIKKNEAAENQRVQAGNISMLRKDAAQMERAQQAVSHSKDSLPPPWDADGQREKYATDPIASFGSFASIFGLAAAAFTHAPMETSFLALTAVNEANKKGDNAAYDKAYKAWEDNTKLAMTRHNMMVTDFNLAEKKFNVDQNAGKAELLAVASKYGDQQSISLMEHGMFPQVFELWDSRVKSALGIQEQAGRIEEQNRVRQILANDPDWKSQDPRRMQQAKQRAEGKTRTPEQEAFDTFRQQNPNATADEQKDFLKDLRTHKTPTPIEEGVARFIEENPKATAQDIQKFINEFKTGSRGQGGPADQRRQEIYDGFLDKIRKEKGREPTAEEKAQANDKAYGRGGISANRRDELQSQYDKANLSIKTMGSVRKILDKHWGVPGTTGYVTRAGESISNLFGSNETDRARFASYIAELKTWGPTVLIGRTGRPLSSEADHMNRIIKGMSMGDTTANTKDNLENLEKLYQTVKKQLQARIEGKWKPDDSGPADSGAASPPPAADFWSADKVVK